MNWLVSIYRIFIRLSLKVKVIVVFLLILITAYFISASIKGGDFASYLEAADKMVHGQNIYAPPHIHLRYSYSPFWAMVLMPFAYLAMPVTVFLWLILNAFLLIRTIHILRNYFDLKFKDKNADIVLWSLILLFMSRFIELNFHHAQMSILLLWLMLESLCLSNENREGTAGVIIGLGTIIKIIPVVMIPYFIYRRKFKAALIAVVTFVIAFYLPIIYLGKDAFAELNKDWFQILRPDSTDFLTDNADYFAHNISALLYRLLMKTDAPYIHNLYSFDYTIATKIVWSIIGVLIILTTYFLATLPFKLVKSKQHIIYEIAYISLIIPLIFPHQMKYAFYFELPAISCLIKYLLDSYQTGKPNINLYLTFSLLCVFFILSVMTTDLLIGMRLTIVTQYLKTITFGALLLIPALALAKKYYVS